MTRVLARFLVSVRGTGSAEVLKALLQAAMFVVVGRALGAAGTGAYAAVLAIVTLLAPFAGLSCGHWLLRTVRRAHVDVAPLLATAIVVTVATGVPAAVLAAVLSHVLLQSPLVVSAMFAVAELLGTSMTTACGLLALGRAPDRRYAVIAVAPFATKFVAACVLVALPDPTVGRWAGLYLTAAIVAVVVALVLVRPTLRRFAPLGRRDARWCLMVSLTQSSQSTVNDLDKVFVASTGDLHAAGGYAGAYKLVSLSYFLARAVQSTLYPQFFSAGEQGYAAVLAVLRRGLRFALYYGGLCAVAGLLLAPLTPTLLGPSFADASTYVRWLSPLLPLKFAQWFVADALTGLDRQGLRGALQAASAVLTAALLAVLVPAHGVAGAVVATYVAEGFYLLGLAAVLVRLGREDRAAAGGPSPIRSRDELPL